MNDLTQQRSLCERLVQYRDVWQDCLTGWIESTQLRSSVLNTSEESFILQKMELSAALMACISYKCISHLWSVSRLLDFC